MHLLEFTVRAERPAKRLVAHRDHPRLALVAALRYLLESPVAPTDN